MTFPPSLTWLFLSSFLKILFYFLKTILLVGHLFRELNGKKLNKRIYEILRIIAESNFKNFKKIFSKLWRNQRIWEKLCSEEWHRKEEMNETRLLFSLFSNNWFSRNPTIKWDLKGIRKKDLVTNSIWWIMPFLIYSVISKIKIKNIRVNGNRQKHT